MELEEQPSVFLIPVATRMHVPRAVEPSKLARELLEKAGLKVYGLSKPVTKPDEIPKFPPEEYDSVVLFIASGGASELAVKVAKDMPYFVWAYDEVNSLPSALSVREKLKGTGQWRGELVYNSLDEAPKQVVSCAQASRLLKSVKGIKLGVIGEEDYFRERSEDARILAELTGVEILSFPISELVSEFAKQSDEAASKIMEHKFSASTRVEPSRKDLLKATKMYLALKSLVDKNDLAAVTADCFKVLKRTGTSMCVALSLLNDEGRAAVCEGDLKAVALMLFFQKLAGVSWTANLAQYSEDLNVVTLAHCTAATSLAEPGGTIILRSHFESDESVGLDVPLKRQPVTIANLQFKPPQMVVAEGEIAESQIGKFSLCRTQAQVRLSGKVSRLLEYAGNHHVLAYGNWANVLARIADKLKVSFIEV